MLLAASFKSRNIYLSKWLITTYSTVIEGFLVFIYKILPDLGYYNFKYVDTFAYVGLYIVYAAVESVLEIPKALE